MPKICKEMISMDIENIIAEIYAYKKELALLQEEQKSIEERSEKLLGAVNVCRGKIAATMEERKKHNQSPTQLH